MRSVAELVQQHFREQAFSFDSLYEAGEDGEGLVQKLLRPALFERRQLAVDVVRAHPSARVLDVGCGSGRVAELVLDAGAASYVGIDFSEPMLELATQRLARFDSRAELHNADFLQTKLAGPFDVIIALGLFDYIEDPVPFVRRFAELCSGRVVASFPVWSWLKGPMRKLRYEVINHCPIFDYTERELRFLFRGAGFESVELRARHSGIFVTAYR
jgi:2-polyprenyl-3-methyl-5-hydroxy-6-metoxy-1,4-benzoquinol methylase